MLREAEALSNFCNKQPQLTSCECVRGGQYGQQRFSNATILRNKLYDSVAEITADFTGLSLLTVLV